MIVLRSMFCLSTMIAALTAFAATETVNGITWTYVVSGNEVSIGGGTDSSPAVPTSTAGAITIPSKLGGYNVTKIGTSAFYNCVKLTTVEIPNNITSIANGAFNGCSGLINVTIPNSVTNIGNYAFLGCSGLTDIIIPNSVKQIGERAFSACNALTSITLPFIGSKRGNTRTADSLFGYIFGVSYYAGGTATEQYYQEYYGKCKTYYIPTSLKSVVITDESVVGYGAFYKCAGLSRVVVPHGITSIGDRAFYSCASMTSFNVPDSVVSIGRWAFSACHGLVNVTMANSVVSIGEYAFWSCNSLKSIAIPDSVVSIGCAAFWGCGELEAITLPFVGSERGNSGAKEAMFGYIFDDHDSYPQGYTGGVPTGAYDFYIPAALKTVVITDESKLGYGAFMGCTMISNIIISSSRLSVGDRAFWGCEGLTSVIMPENVPTIGDSAFRGCRSLAKDDLVIVRDVLYEYIGTGGSVTIPDGTLAIGWHAFDNCVGLIDVVIPDSVTSIGEEAFCNCIGLNSVRISDLVAWCKVSFKSENSNPLTYAHNLYLNDELVTNLIIPEGVTSIGNRAFQGCHNITNVTMPHSVKGIGEYAFNGCVGLNDIVVPNSVTNIGKGCFTRCTNLVSVTLPFIGSCRGSDGDKTSIFGHIFGQVMHDGLTNIVQAYTYNSNSTTESRFIPVRLKSVTITDETIVPKGAFDNCRTIGQIILNDGMTKICEYAFAHCTGLKDLTIPQSVISMGQGSLCDCASLKALTLPFVGSKRGNSGTKDSVFGYIFGTASYTGGQQTTQCYDGPENSPSIVYYIPTSLKSVTITDESALGYSSFYACSGLTNIAINSSVTKIGGYSFRNCTGISSFAIPVTLKDIECGSFRGAANLNTVAIPYGVTNIGNNAFQECSGLTSVTIPDSVTSIGSSAFYGCSGLASMAIPDSVTNIGESAFFGCSGLTSVTIPDSVTSIGSSAFYGCSGLASVTIPDSVTRIGSSAFCGCSGLIKIELPFVGSKRGNSGASDSLFGYVFGTSSYTGGVTTKQYYSPSTYSTYYIPSSLNLVTITDESALGYGAFYGCSGLTNITIVDSVVKVGDNAFEGCSGLESVNLPNGLNDLGRNDFRSANLGSGLCAQSDWVLGYIGEAPAEVVVPEGVTGIASYAFEGQMGLERVRLPSTLKYIGVNAFMGCTALEEVEIPDAVEKIDDGAFKNCTWLQDLKLPQQLKIIGKEAFANCAMLPNLVCEEGLTAIGEQAFSNCWRMLSVSLPVSLTSVGANAFVDCKRLAGVMAPTHIQAFAALFPSAYTNINTVVVPDGERTLTTNAFKGCKLLSDITIPSTVTQVCASAFQDCTALTSITLPNDIEELGESAFQGCIALENVKLPRSLKNIGNSAFRSCSALGELSLPNSVLAIGDYTFCGDARLESINLPNALKSVGAYAFSGCSKVTAAGYVHGLHSIGAYAYQNCSSVRDVYIPSSVTNLGVSIFYNCASITNITTATAHRTMASLFPKVYNTIEQIGIAPGETKICDGCFSGCAAMTEIGIPDSVTTMGASAFNGCANLARVSLSSQLEALPDYAFKNCSSLATLTIPEGVVSLGKNVFEGCSKLESLYFVGNAPAYDAAVFSGIGSGVTVFVVNGSMGWDGVATSRALPESWPTSNSRAITYWEPNRFDVVFDANGGLPESSVIEQITGMTYALPKVVPTKSGATFLGWWTEPVNGAQVMAGTQVTLTRAHTFYAHWAGNLYRVAFEANGGMGEMSEQTCMVGEVSELPLNVFAKPGFAFVGWATEPDGAVVYGDGASVVDLTQESDASVVLYAVWDAKAWATGDYMNAPGRLFTMGDGEGWTSDVVVYHDGVGSMRSGKIGLESESTMLTTVVGEGVVSFWWKVSCEETYKGDRYDYVAFCVDGVEKGWMAGETDWTRATFEVVGSGSHTLTWIYHKDDWDEPDYDGDDCAWIDEFVWEPAAVTVTFDGNGNTAGAAPKAVVKYEGYSLTMPGAGTLERFSYVFGGWSDGKNVYAPGSIYVFTGDDVEFSAVWTEKVWTYADFLNCTNILFTASVGTEWFGDFVTNHDLVVSARSAAIGDGEVSWIQGVASGVGTLSFWTKVSGEERRGRMYDYLNVTVDNETVYSAANVNWTNVTVNVASSGAHTIRWTYMKDLSNSVGYDCAWLDEVTWTPSAALPSVAGDDGAQVVGDADNGYIVRPSLGKEDVVVAIPDGVDAGKVTIELSPSVRSVTANGAVIKVVDNGHDITEYLSIPPAVGGVVEIGEAKVKGEIVKETLDVTKGAKITINPEAPSLTTANTREGLSYTLLEGVSLGDMKAGDSKVGDGNAWTPHITVKGGESGFYTIQVDK